MDKNKQKEVSDFLTREYLEIMESAGNSSFVVPVQWTNSGDAIEKFSLYENYTPVKTSGSTTLNE